MKNGDAHTTARSECEPRITFGMIVLNGEPFTRYNLRSLYTWAHQIIVVEGACPAAASVATPDGHSTDGTLEVVKAFMRDEDPEGKVLLITAEDEGQPNGFWTEKDEMSRAYASRTTGNYLWQVDGDEFYTERSMRQIIGHLRSGADTVSVPQLTFWGRPDAIASGFYLLAYQEAREIHRVFRWEPGFSYTAHRPPTVVDREGTNLRDKNWIRESELRRDGVFMLHYSLLLPSQVFGKSTYYAGASWSSGFMSGAERWAQECWGDLKKPFRVHNVYDHLSWLERYDGEWPEQIRMMWDELTTDDGHRLTLRPMDDVEALLNRPGYWVATRILRTVAPICSTYVIARRAVRQFAKRLIRRPSTGGGGR